MISNLAAIVTTSNITSKDVSEAVEILEKALEVVKDEKVIYKSFNLKFKNLCLHINFIIFIMIIN